MESLSNLLAGPPDGVKPRKGTGHVEIRDEGTKQSLVIDSDEPLAGYHLDVPEAGWGAGEQHPDGVLVGELNGIGCVCFVELKGRFDKKAFRQLEGGARHFHPAGRGTTIPSHGAGHHDRWVAGTDPISVRPVLNHLVLGVVVVNRAGTRQLPNRVKIGKAWVALHVVQLSATRNQATTTFRKLLRAAGHPR